MAHPFNRLLLATEHSEYDTGAEALAFAMARRCGLPLAGVLPIVSNPEYEALAPQIVAHAEAQARTRIDALRAAASAAGIDFDLRARRGPEPYREIVDEAQAHGADLLLIRRRGKRGLLAQLLVGEMVANVVSHAPCSVLIATMGARMWSRRVLVAVDPQAVDARLFALAAAVARECGLPMTLMAVCDSASAEARQQAQAVLQGLATASDSPVDTWVGSGRAHEQILAVAAQCGADLIVIGRHGESRLARAWLGGVTQKVVGLAELPVLVAVFPSTSEGQSA